MLSLLQQWCSKCGSWIRSISLIWELVRNTDTWAPSPKSTESEVVNGGCDGMGRSD